MKQFMSALEQIAEEKGISENKVIETIEAALAAAYKKDYGQKSQHIQVKMDRETGQIKVYQVKTVVDKQDLQTEEGEERPLNEEREIMIKDAKKIKKKAKPGHEIQFKLKSKSDFGRIAAQTAKQVIIQRIREAERESIFDEFKAKQGEIVSGIVQRIEPASSESGINVFIDIGRATGILLPSEQIPLEKYQINQRLKIFITEIDPEGRGPNIILSRTHPEMLKNLFELEVPEISAGTVKIKSVAREPGARSKIAVSTSEENIDPIGSCVGQKGTRVQTIIDELDGEKIDIILWDKNTKTFISNALSPAKVQEVKLDKDKKQAITIVAEDQLSLAIGKQGQNVRLAAKLTGWKIDVKAKEKEEKEEKKIKKKVVKKIKTKKKSVKIKKSKKSKIKKKKK
ncbi:transcription termination/antitermination protein NusA [bacterium]|nr:transcription termination/antitermination protein NusA [bacterium]